MRIKKIKKPKRVNQRKLAKKLKNKSFKEWKASVRERDGNACIICGRTDIVHCHHLIPREIHEYRFDVKNGVTLCPKHHKYAFDISAHKNPIAFIIWLIKNRPDTYDYIFEKMSKDMLLESDKTTPELA